MTSSHVLWLIWKTLVTSSWSSSKTRVRMASLTGIDMTSCTGSRGVIVLPTRLAGAVPATTRNCMILSVWS